MADVIIYRSPKSIRLITRDNTSIATASARRSTEIRGNTLR